MSEKVVQGIALLHKFVLMRQVDRLNEGRVRQAGERGLATT